MPLVRSPLHGGSQTPIGILSGKPYPPSGRQQAAGETHIQARAHGAIVAASPLGISLAEPPDCAHPTSAGAASMRVFVNTSGTINGGSLTHLRHLLPPMLDLAPDDEFILGANDRVAESIGFVPGLKYLRTDVDFADIRRRLAWENRTLPRILRQENVDIVFHPNNIPLFRCPVPHVNLLHNVAPFMPAIIAGESLKERLRLRLLRALTTLGFRYCDSTIFISEWGKQLALDVSECPYDPGPLIPFGRDYQLCSPDREGLAHWELEPGRYLLSISHFYRYKRIEHLIQAYIDLGSAVADVPLVLVGSWFDEQYAAELRELAADAQGRVLFTGGLNARLVYGLLKSCRVFIFTSEAENLPIALLEAMFHGAPILTNRSCSMPEACGDAAIYVETRDAEGYRRALVALLEDEPLRQLYARLSRGQAAQFSWKQAAASTIDLLHRVARARGAARRRLLALT